ncbi:hypothetical protein [Butyrivibrio sp. JL13D10]|uniref:hypothetical protein n=1 Tax=Butyrivibrio sp. JL13D10 TaxID=3236815 RepID=UPI0038B422E4
MSRFSKVGATALALALSLTMVAPITANAEVNWTREKDGTKEKEIGYDYEADKPITEQVDAYKYTYTNEDTKESFVVEKADEEDEASYKIINALESELKTFTIATKSYNETKSFSTTVDVAKYANFKSNKKNLKIKVISQREYTDPDNPKTNDYFYSDYRTFTDKDGNYYYRDVNGKLAKVEKDKVDTDAPKGYDYGNYTVRFYAKKAGKYTVTYDAVMKDGKTVQKSFQVIAKEDGAAIKNITYAGKTVAQSLDSDKAAENKLWAKNYGNNTTTLKSGKLKVTMNKDFKLKKIEVGTPSIETKTEKDWTSTKYTVANSSLDTNEYGATCTWKKVNNGKKIKLSKVDDSAVDMGGYNAKTTTFSSKATSTTTYIRVTYYDKKNKTTERATYTINLVQK